MNPTTQIMRDNRTSDLRRTVFARTFGLALVAMAAFALFLPAIAGAAYETTTCVTSDTSAKKQLTMSGNIVAWVDYRDGRAEIYTYNLATGVERRITNSAGDKKLPVVDLNRLAWLEVDTSYSTQPYRPHFFSLVDDCEIIAVQAGMAPGFEYKNSFRIGLIKDTVIWEADSWAYDTYMTWRPNTWGCSLVSTMRYEPTRFYNNYPSSESTRVATSGDYQGWAGYDAAAGKYGIWVAKQPKYVNSVVKTFINVPPAWQSNPVTITLTTDGPVKKTYYQVSTDTGWLPAREYTGPFSYDTMPIGFVPYQGPTYLTYYSEALDGTMEPSHLLTFATHGATPPVTATYTYVPPSATTNPWTNTAVPSVPGTSPTSGWVGVERSTSSAIVQFTSADVNDTVITYTLNGGAPKKALGNLGGSVTIPRNVEAKHVLQWSVKNAIGSVEPTQTGYVNIDLYAPTTSTQFNRGWQKESVVVTLTATDSMSGIRNMYYRQSSDNGLNWSTTTTYTAPFTVSRDGTTKLEFWAVDNSGRMETKKSDTVQIDRTMPVTTPVRLLPGQAINGGYSFAFSATDLVGIRSICWRVNEGPTKSSSAWYNIWLGDYPAEVVQGTNTIEYWSIDNAGNEATHRTMDITYDSIAPVVISDIPDHWDGIPYYVTLNAVDSGSGVSYVRYMITHASPLAVPRQTGPGFGPPLDLVSEPEQLYSYPFMMSTLGDIRYYAVDLAGNQSMAVNEPKAWGIDHTTTTPVTSCQGPGCHAESLVKTHNDSCFGCHAGPGGDPIQPSRDCNACHPGSDHTFTKHVDPFDYKCQRCHYFNLAGEHTWFRNTPCQSCHNPSSGALISAAPRAVSFAQSACSDCHKTVHGLAAGGSKPTSVPLDPSFTWTQPTDAGVYEAEGWFPAAAVGKGAQIAVSNRAAITPAAEWTYLSQQMTALGWTATSAAPTEGDASYVATFSLGRNRAAAVVWSGATHTAESASGLGTKVELVWWSESQ